MRNTTKYLIALAITGFAFTLKPPKKQIFLIGDSTMSDKVLTALPETGWGMVFSKFVDTSNTVIYNSAKNGSSTRTFIEEGFWKPVVQNLRKGDLVLIQFGHNDEVQTKPQSTTEKEFQRNLTRYINEVKSRNAIPVLLTPVARRSITAGGNFEDTHKVYSELVRKVARKNNVSLIDLDRKSQALLQTYGIESSKWLFNHLKAGQHPNYPEGKTDNTHFSELGARKIAEIVYKELIGINPGDINQHFFKPKPKQ